VRCAGDHGFGAWVLLAFQVAQHWGCEVHVRTRSQHGREQAEATGAASIGADDERAPALDAAVTFAPSSDVVVAALRSLAPGGSLAINAMRGT